MKLPSIEIKLKIADASQKVTVRTFRFTARLNMTFALGRVIYFAKKWSFPLRISLVNIIKTAENRGFVPIYRTKTCRGNNPSKVKLGLWKK